MSGCEYFMSGCEYFMFGSTYLTEMEKSPGELWHPRITKSPTVLCLSSSSAWLRLASSLNQLESKKFSTPNRFRWRHGGGLMVLRALLWSLQVDVVFGDESFLPVHLSLAPIVLHVYDLTRNRWGRVRQALLSRNRWGRVRPHLQDVVLPEAELVVRRGGEFILPSGLHASAPKSRTKVRKSKMKILCREEEEDLQLCFWAAGRLSGRAALEITS